MSKKPASLSFGMSTEFLSREVGSKSPWLLQQAENFLQPLCFITDIECGTKNKFEKYFIKLKINPVCNLPLKPAARFLSIGQEPKKSILNSWNYLKIVILYLRIRQEEIWRFSVNGGFSADLNTPKSCPQGMFPRWGAGRMAEEPLRELRLSLPPGVGMQGCSFQRVSSRESVGLA